MHMCEWNIIDFDRWMPSAIDGQGSAEGLQAQEVCKASLEWGNIIHPNLNEISSSRSLKAMCFSVAFNTSVRFNECSMLNAKDSKVDWDFWGFLKSFWRFRGVLGEPTTPKVDGCGIKDLADLMNQRYKNGYCMPLQTTSQCSSPKRIEWYQGPWTITCHVCEWAEGGVNQF